MRSVTVFQQLTIGSLFAGIGGFDLAGEAMGWRTSWFVELDASCRHWLAANFPGRPIYGDITEVNFAEVECVDVLCGGFPCQPASAAGKRLGTADERWLWPHFARAIGALRPRYVVAENVPGLLSVNGGRAFAEVLRDLAALGYDAEWSGLSAGDVGSPQERERVWIVAYAQDGVRRSELGGVAGGEGDEAREARCGRVCERVDGDRLESRGEQLGSSARGGWRAGAGVEVRRAERGCSIVGDTQRQGEPQLQGVQPDERRWPGDGSEELGNADEPSSIPHATRGRSRSAIRERRGRMGRWDDATLVRGADGTIRLIPREAAEQGPRSPLWPVADGLPGRVARLRAIGNTVVPQCVVEGPFRVIQERELSPISPERPR